MKSQPQEFETYTLIAQFAGADSPLENRQVRIRPGDGEILVETGGEWLPCPLLKKSDADDVRHRAGVFNGVPLTHR
jgi:hypothetical protein